MFTGLYSGNVICLGAKNNVFLMGVFLEGVGII